MAKLIPEFEGIMLFGVVLLEGEMAGVSHCLELSANTSRRRLGLLIQHAGVVGPVVLTRYRVDMNRAVWLFAERYPDGALWHELSDIEPYVPEVGDPDPEPS